MNKKKIEFWIQIFITFDKNICIFNSKNYINAFDRDSIKKWLWDRFKQHRESKEDEYRRDLKKIESFAINIEYSFVFNCKGKIENSDDVAKEKYKRL